MNEDQIADIWTMFKEYLDKKALVKFAFNFVILDLWSNKCVI